MLARLLLLLFLLATLVGLVPLAHASPPDPAWISGLYDDADYDNVVVAATSMVGPEDSAPVAAITPATIVLAIISLLDETVAPTAALSPRHTRAPPIHP